MKYPFQKLFLICTGERCNDAKNGEDRGEMIRAELKEINKKLGRKATVRVGTRKFFGDTPFNSAFSAAAPTMG